MNMKYRFIDHTADIAFEVYGSSLNELIENAAYAFYEAFVDTSGIGETEEKRVEVNGEDEETLLYRWLNELLYFFDVEYFAGKRVSVDVRDKGRSIEATGVLEGGKFTPEMVIVEPKAITMHKFQVKRDKEGWKAFIVIDI